MKGKDFLITARMLSLPDVTSEAHFRSAASRAYYACYISMRDFVNDARKNDAALDTALSNASISEEIKHTDLWALLGKAESSVVRNLKDTGKSMLSARKVADYKMNCSYVRTNATDVIIYAESFFKMFETTKGSYFINTIKKNLNDGYKSKAKN